MVGLKCKDIFNVTCFYVDLNQVVEKVLQYECLNSFLQLALAAFNIEILWLAGCEQTLSLWESFI